MPFSLEQIEATVTMDADKSAGSLAELRQRVLELRQHGHDEGLKDAEITACISQALKDSTSASAPLDDKSEARKAGSSEAVPAVMAPFHRWKENISKGSLSRQQKCVVVVAVIVVVLGATFMTASFNRPVSRLLTTVRDKAMRFIRRAVLPIHRVANISVYHYEECLVSNPLYDSFHPSCALCRRLKQVTTSNSSQAFSFLRIPVLHKGSAASPVSLAQVLKMVSDNRKAVDLPTMQFMSTVPWVTSAVDLAQSDLKEKIMNHEGFHFEWFTADLSAVRVIRQLFPRPPSFPAIAEVCIARSLLVDGPGVQSYFPRKAYCANAMLVVGEGEWEAWLHPPPHCSSECHPLQVRLQPRDALMFPGERYSLEVRPGEAGGVAILMSSMQF